MLWEGLAPQGPLAFFPDPARETCVYEGGRGPHSNTGPYNKIQEIPQHSAERAITFNETLLHSQTQWATAVPSTMGKSWESHMKYKKEGPDIYTQV